MNGLIGLIAGLVIVSSVFGLSHNQNRKHYPRPHLPTATATSILIPLPTVWVTPLPDHGDPLPPLCRVFDDGHIECVKAGG